MKVKWQKGNGNFRLLIAREGAAVDAFPLDGEDYTGNAAFGMGDEVGTGNFVVYQGMDDSVEITGLDPAKTYHFRLFDYNKNFNTGFHSLYQLCDYAAASAKTSTNTSITDLTAQGIRLFPNPVRDVLHLEFSKASGVDQLQLSNLHGQLMRRQAVTGLEAKLDVSDLPAQMYVLTLYKDGRRVGSAKVVIE